MLEGMELPTYADLSASAGACCFAHVASRFSRKLVEKALGHSEHFKKCAHLVFSLPLTCDKVEAHPPKASYALRKVRAFFPP